MRLLTHNMLSSNIKGVINGFPLRIEPESVITKQVDFNPDFLKNMFPKIDWKALADAAKTMGYPDLPDEVPDHSVLDSDEFLKKKTASVPNRASLASSPPRPTEAYVSRYPIEAPPHKRLMSASPQFAPRGAPHLRFFKPWRPVKSLFLCSYHTALKFGGDAGISSENPVPRAFNNQKHKVQHSACSMMLSRALYSSEANTTEVGPTEAAKELHDKLLKSVIEQRTAPPNNWLWALIEKCENREDIKLLFNVLENIRKFRLSNLRIYGNFNDNLCREVSKACVRAEAIDFGKKTLWKHNVYGLTPSVACAHSMLLYAKEHNDVNLMVDVIKLLKANDVPMQPGTADIIFSICYNTGNWDLMCKYAKRFVISGLKLRRTSFDTWMTFAAKLGDVDSLWKIEKVRSGLMKTHTIGSGFACAKGLLLERKPEEAAAIIHVVTQTLPEGKRPDITAELEKLVSEWPLEVIKSRKDEDKMALAAGLQKDIPAMIDSLSGLGVKTNLKVDDLTKMPF